MHFITGFASFLVRKFVVVCAVKLTSSVITTTEYFQARKRSPLAACNLSLVGDTCAAACLSTPPPSACEYFL